MGRPEKIGLGDTLGAQNIIPEDQRKGALKDKKKTGGRLGRVLIEQGFLNEEQIYFNNELVRRLPETQARPPPGHHAGARAREDRPFVRPRAAFDPAPGPERAA